MLPWPLGQGDGSARPVGALLLQCLIRKCMHMAMPCNAHGSKTQRNAGKFRFALSLFSLFHILAIIGSAKDVYLEKFGADATAIGFLFSVISFWSPLTEFLVGRLMDRACLARFFPLETWGKRAPFLLTHCIIAASAASVVYMPPSHLKKAMEEDLNKHLRAFKSLGASLR